MLPEPDGLYHFNYNEQDFYYNEDGSKIPLRVCLCAARSPSECLCACNSWGNYSFDEWGGITNEPN